MPRPTRKVEPDAKRDRKPELTCDLRKAFQTLRGSISAHRLCVCGNRGEVGADLRFGCPQAVRRWFGEPVVGDARQLSFDRGHSGIRILSAQNGRCMHATRLTSAAKVPSDITRWRPLAAPIQLPYRATSSGVFILVPCSADNLRIARAFRLSIAIGVARRGVVRP